MQTDTQATKPVPESLAPGDLLTEAEAAPVLNVRVQTLRNWRCRDAGPRYRKVGGRMVRYLRSDLAEFIENGVA